MVKAIKDSGVEWIGDVSKSWSVKEVGKIFKERNEKVSDYDYQPLSVTKNGIVLQLENAAKSDNHDNRKKVKKNDFVINSRSDRKMSSGLSNFEGSVSVINIVLHSEKVEPEFTKYVLKNYGFAEEFYRWGTGIVADLWSTRFERMKRISIPFPVSKAEQKKIANFLDEKTSHIDSIIEETKQSIEEFKKYKQALITETVTKGLNTNVKMKDSGIEWIGEIPEHWEVSRLKYLIEFEPPKTELLVKNINCTFLPMEKLRNGKMNVDTEVLIEDVYSGYSYFKENDIVLAKVTPCFENGNIAIAENLENGIGFGTTEIFTIRPQKINTQYLFYRFQEQTFKEKGKSTMYGVGGLKRVPGSFITNYKIGVPSPEEQQQIARYLDEKTTHIDSLIENKVKMIGQLEEYKTSIIYEYVTGKKEVE